MDPCFGHYTKNDGGRPAAHPGRKAVPGRASPSLALGLLEGLRPVIAERLALSLINRKQIRGGAFRTAEAGGVVMDDSSRKELLVAYQPRKQEESQHPFLGCGSRTGAASSANLLAHFIRGDLDGYPCFLWK